MNQSRWSGDRRGAIIWWLSAALLVAVGWLATPHAVTVYDGVGQPDEPYRYVSAPPGAKFTLKPTGGKATLAVVGGVNARYASVISAESGPQVSIALPEGGLAAASGAIDIELVPEAPSGQPADGAIDGNMYRLSLTNAAGPVTFTAKTGNAWIYLRATTARQPGPVIEHRSGPGQNWRLLLTSRFGNEIYASALPAAGEYALVFLAASTPTAAGSSPAATQGAAGSNNRGLIGGLLVLFVILVSVVLAVRRQAHKLAP